MLESSWEVYATQLANAKDDETLLKVYNKLIMDLRIKEEAPSEVVFARDTRESGPALVAALVDALEATGTHYQDFGTFTTPQLHYVTRCINTKDTANKYGEPTEEGYYKKMADAFKIAMKNKRTQTQVTVDCANGVGGPKLRELVKHLPTLEQGGVNIRVVNDNTTKPELLNADVSPPHSIEFHH
jgi:phosphoacetylglucosamine mutase